MNLRFEPLRARVGRVVACAALFACASHAYAGGDDPANDEVKTTPLRGTVSLIEAAGGFGGGNIAASIGDDGVLIVDAMSGGIAPKLGSALGRLSSMPVRIVVNTHFHLDHAGGNAGLGATATIVAHESVRKRLDAAHMPAPGLPAITYGDTAPSLHFNGEGVHLTVCTGAHTEADTIVYFDRSRVVHLGDLFFSGMFPAVYRESGGNWKGLIACLGKVLPTLPEDTIVIGGHGPVAHMSDLRSYLSMLEDTTAIVEQHLAHGESASQMNEQHVLAKYDALGSGGAQATPQYVEMLVKLLSPARAPDAKP